MAELYVLSPLLSPVLLPVLWCSTTKWRKLNVEATVEKQTKHFYVIKQTAGFF